MKQYVYNSEYPATPRRLVRIGFRLTKHGRLVPDSEQGHVEYSVDRTTTPPDGYILIVDDDDKEYFIPKNDVTQPYCHLELVTNDRN